MRFFSAFCQFRKKAGSGRLKISTSEWAHLETKVQSDPVLSNAFRLMADASLLMDFQRYSSALALAVLSLEEIGKYILEVWTAEDKRFSYDKHKLHQMKQAAIGALFMAEGARKEFRKVPISPHSSAHPEEIALLVRAIMDGLKKTSWFAEASKGKAIDVIKWSGIYFDSELALKGIQPSNIKEADALGIMQLCSRAFMLVGDDSNVAIAKYIFPTIYETEVTGP